MTKILINCVLLRWSILALALADLGCSTPHKREVESARVQDSMPLGVQIAVTRAVAALKNNGQMPEHFKLTAKRVEDYWDVTFQFVPYGPGLEITVFVHDNGKIAILPGY